MAKTLRPPKTELDDQTKYQAQFADFKNKLHNSYKRRVTQEHCLKLPLEHIFATIHTAHIQNDHCRGPSLKKLLTSMNQRFIDIYLKTTKDHCSPDCKPVRNRKPSGKDIKRISVASTDSGLPISRNASQGNSRQVDNKEELRCKKRRISQGSRQNIYMPKPTFNKRWAKRSYGFLNEELPKLPIRRRYRPDELDETVNDVEPNVENADSFQVTSDRVGKFVAPFLTPGAKIVSDTIPTIVLDGSSMLYEENDFVLSETNENLQLPTSSNKADITLKNSPSASTLRKVPKSISSIASESSSMLCEEYGSLLVRTLEKDRPTCSKTAGATLMDSAQVRDIMKDFADKLLGQFMDLYSKPLESELLKTESNSCKTCAMREVSRESQACQTDIRSSVPIKLEFQKMEPISFQSAQYSQGDVLKPPMPKIVNHSVSSLMGRFQRLELCSMVGKTAQMKDVESEVPQNVHNLYKNSDAKIDNEKFYSPHINEYDSYDLSAEDSTNSLLEVTKSLLEQSTSSENIPATEKTPCGYCGTPFKSGQKRRIHYVKEHLKDIFGEGSQQCQSPEFQDGNCSSQNRNLDFYNSEQTGKALESHNSEGTEEISTQSAEYSLESSGIGINGTPESRVTPKPNSRQKVCFEFINEENSSADNAKNSGLLYYCENGHYNCDDCNFYEQHFTKICNVIDTTPPGQFRNQTRTSNGVQKTLSRSTKESTRIGSCIGTEQLFLDQSINLEEPLQEYMSQKLEDDKENRENSTSLYGIDQFRENLRALNTHYRAKKILSLSKENCTEEASQSDIPTSVNCEEESQQSKYDASRGTSNGSTITSLSSEPVRETSFMAGLSRQKSCSIKESTRIGSCLGSEQSFLDQSVNLEEPRQEYMSQELEDDKENGEQSTSLYGIDQFRENLRALNTPYRPIKILSLSKENCIEEASQSDMSILISVNCKEESQQSKYDASRGKTPSFEGCIPRVSSAMAGRSGIRRTANQNLYSFCALITDSSEEH
ncbi:hypothetical protein DdX_08114 [Ditylenchus destructor]|uniref:Uncharacterized protein n=1 Tax=Ditylenchus destructor TaxID=166010 RepID=A0AAD4N4I6_9BILA|nr:hypothetical protein DdX_08114 [Ditylenchus destructor]